jgi:hypothetical protein
VCGRVVNRVVDRRVISRLAVGRLAVGRLAVGRVELLSGVVGRPTGRLVVDRCGGGARLAVGALRLRLVRGRLVRHDHIVTPSAPERPQEQTLIGP